MAICGKVIWLFPRRPTARRMFRRFGSALLKKAACKLAPALASAAESALALGLEQLSATGPELELYALAHARADARLFAT